MSVAGLEAANAECGVPGGDDWQEDGLESQLSSTGEVAEALLGVEGIASQLDCPDDIFVVNLENLVPGDRNEYGLFLSTLGKFWRVQCLGSICMLRS